ncbi:MAG TPA: sugar ABC transporter permease [Propioniciclava sp.]|jgi:multiple sugar transport system permease protein|uniref:carbohydrate ABC transporter permease n=1 Tax=Propioniciclava sp. TaxID=2038686 RepID=UPI002C71B523|nr:sugar ABC transporter permease [Propioniciclava sp.]HRL48216.1 sugar ABC transporter permease [Propioniciclava sp.]HRL81161.1 sugar ABC transporter permease [Propioniciclava sp.]
MTTESLALVDTPVRPPRRTARARARRVEAAVLVIPALIPILIFSVAPLLSGIGLAFTDASLRRNATNQFIGLQNFADLLGDTMFWESFRIGMVWAVSVTTLQLVAGLVLALLLNANLRFQGLARVLALIPWAMPPVVVAIMWQLIYSTNGPLNAVLSLFGPTVTTNWLGDFSTALPAVIVVGVWVGMPQTTITLLAALQQIPTEQVEAAAMDGANAWRRFRHVSLPAIRPVMASITSLNFIWNFNSFGLVYVMTEGGPGGRTMLPMLFTYLEAFKSRNLGYASAMGCVLVLIVVLLLAIYLWSQFREKEAK